MVNRGRFLGAAMAAALLLGGCEKKEEDGESGESGPESEAEAGDEVPFLRTFPASTSGGPEAARRSVIRDATGWADLWAKSNAHIAPVPKAPAVDFSKEVVAFAALGQKPTAGFSIEIVGARKEYGKLVLLVAERAPAAGAPAAAVVTSPWHAVVLEKSDLPMEWRAYDPPKPVSTPVTTPAPR